MNRIGPGFIVAIVLFASGMRVAEADVTIQERVAVEGSGLMSMASMSGTSTISISGKRALMQNDMNMHSGFIRMLARGAGQTAEIVRLDDDTIYVLDMKKKRYQRTSVAARRAELNKAMTQATQAQQANPMAFDDSQCDWSEPKLTVGKSGTKTIVGGLSAAPVSIVARQSCKDRRSAAVCDIALSFEEWVAGTASGAQEALKFRAAYAEQMGIANQGRDVAERAQLLFGRYKQAWALVADEMRKVNGFPVKTRFAHGLGGPGCNGPAGGSGDAATGASGAPSPGALAGQIAGLFGRKKNPPDDRVAESSDAGPPALSGMVVPLTMTSELLSITSESLGASTFEVPAGFKESAR
jgi:hypothetical protein